MYVFWRILSPPVADAGFSGWSAVSPDEKHIVVSNLYDGLDFYSIPDRALSRSVPCFIDQQNNRPIPARFSNDGNTVIVGGTSGSVKVLDASSCETLQVLLHNGWLSSLAFELRAD
jgi:COMPASS component SWD3